jgi:V/A-type H+-transporting ATPase subunit D
MRVRHPHGRAGRPWLTHRLAVARRGAGLLDEKHRALARERRRLEPFVAQAADEWLRRAADAERWLERAVVMGGERQLEVAAAGAIQPAEVLVRWHTVLGVTCPAEAPVETQTDAQLSARGGSAALLAAAEAHRRALDAAARLGVAEGALGRIDAELRATALRRNAIERRWIPAHEAALAALDLSLEETEREEGAGVRWVTIGTSDHWRGR